MKVDISTFPLPEHIDPSWRIGLVHTVYYEAEMNALLEGALSLLTHAGIDPTNVTRYPAFGSFEIPLIGAALLEADKVDALIGFGIIVQGATQHADHLAREVSRGMMDVQLAHGKPFAYEVLHVNSLDDARDRTTGDNNKGVEAAVSVLHSLAQLQRITS